MVEHRSAESEGLRFDSSWELRIFSLSHARDKTKNIFLYFFTELKTYHLSYSIYKHDAIDIADPSSMQDACHMNFVIDLAHRGVSVAEWLEHRSAESEGLRFDSSWGLRIFSLSHARDKTKNIFLKKGLNTRLSTCLIATVIPQ